MVKEIWRLVRKPLLHSVQEMMVIGTKVLTMELMRKTQILDIFEGRANRIRYGWFVRERKSTVMSRLLEQLK